MENEYIIMMKHQNVVQADQVKMTVAQNVLLQVQGNVIVVIVKFLAMEL